LQELKKRKYCRRCGIFISAENEQYGAGDFCKSCAESMVSRQSFNVPADLSYEIDIAQVSDSAETHSDSTATDRKFCHGCGRKMTAENKMFGTNPDGSRNEEYCQSCIEDRYNPLGMIYTTNIAYIAYVFIFTFVIFIFVKLSRC